MFEARSALAGVTFPTPSAALALRERPVAGLWQIGTYAGGLSAAGSVVSAAGHALPSATAQVHAEDGRRLYRIAADQYWWLAESAAAALPRAAFPAGDFSVTDLSAARVWIDVDGTAARRVLAQLVTVDLDPDVFAVGDFAQTGMEHVGVLLERRAEDGYTIAVLRTFARTVVEGLLAAAARTVLND